jgi:hypothetical protein
MTGKSTKNLGSKKGSFSENFLEQAYGLSELPEVQARRVKNLLALLKAIRECNKTHSLDDSIRVIIEASCQILNCDRATLFMVDEIAQELVIRQAVGAEAIKIPLTAGIAGAVYTEGKALNIADPYKDARFNSQTDKQTG